MSIYKYVPKNGQTVVVEDYVVPPAGLEFNFDNVNLNRYTVEILNRYVDGVYDLPVIQTKLTGLNNYDGELIGYIGKDDKTKYFAEYVYNDEGVFGGLKVGDEIVPVGDTIENVVGSLESLTGEERLDVNAVKDAVSLQYYLADGYDVRLSGVVVGTGLSAQRAYENTVALNHAFSQAALLGKTAILPDGVIEYRANAGVGRLTSGCNIKGKGKYQSILKCVDPEGNISVLLGTASNVSWSDFGMHSTFLLDNRPENNSAIKFEPASGIFYDNLRFSNLDFRNISGACLLLKRVRNVEVLNITAFQTGADVVHFAGPSDGLVVDNVFAENAGDDVVAFVGYSGGNVVGKPKNGRVSNVFVKNSWHGRGVTVVGGEYIQISNVTVDGCTSSGILVSAEPGFGTFPSNDVSIENVKVSRCGSSTAGAIQFGSSTVVGYEVSNISIFNSKIYDSNNRGLVGVNAHNVKISNLEIVRSGDGGLHFTQSSNLSIDETTVKACVAAGLFFTNTCSGYLLLNNLIFNNVSSGNSSGNVIGFESKVTPYFSRIEMDNIRVLIQDTGLGRVINNSMHSGVTKYGSNIYSVKDSGLAGGSDPYALGIATSPIALTGSPMTWDNTTPLNQIVRIGGANVSLVESLVNEIAVPYTKTNGVFLVRAGTSIRITYSSASGVTISRRPQSLI